MQTSLPTSGPVMFIRAFFCMMHPTECPDAEAKERFKHDELRGVHQYKGTTIMMSMTALAAVLLYLH
jgi:hypothetical protein